MSLIATILAGGNRYPRPPGTVHEYLLFSETQAKIDLSDDSAIRSIMAYVDEYGRATIPELAEELGISDYEVGKRLKKLAEAKKLKMEQKRIGALRWNEWGKYEP